MAASHCAAVLPAAEETQNTVSAGRLSRPVAGLRVQTVRSRRNTVFNKLCHGVPRNHALAGNTFSSRISQRFRPTVRFSASSIGRRHCEPSSRRRRNLGWLSLTCVARGLPPAITCSKVFLCVRGVEREHAVLQPERLYEFRRGRNFVALLVDHQMPQNDRNRYDSPTSLAVFG